jgi:glycosyltransferase involved in cell wall biosynthesis
MDEVNELLHTAQRLELADAVALLGAVPRKEVAELLARSDIFVLPSLFEGLSNACIEAMATGLPVVVTDVGGMSELVRDGVDGFVVPPEDPAALAERIGKLIDDPTLAERFGSSGRTRVEESFRLEDQLDAFEKVYSRLSGLRRER